MIMMVEKTDHVSFSLLVFLDLRTVHNAKWPPGVSKYSRVGINMNQTHREGKTAAVLFTVGPSKV